MKASELRELPGVEEVETIGAAFIHFFCDTTTAVQINGLWVEILNPSDRNLNPVQSRARDVLMSLFPALRLAHGRVRG